MTTNYCRCGCGKSIGDKSMWAKGHNPNKTKDRFDWGNVVGDYERLGTLEKVAYLYSCSQQAVYYQLKKRGVDTSLSVTDWAENIESDYKELKSVNKIAKKYNCSIRTVTDKLKTIEGFKVNHDNKGMDVEVGIGRYGERIALCLLNGSEDMNKITIQYPYDLIWKSMKIDVKTSNKRKRKNGKIQYSFSTKNNECDKYLLIALDDENIPIKLLLVPREEVKGVSVSFTIGSESKWDKYKMEVSEYELRKAVQSATNIEG
jgi:hypothetical protein